MADAPAPLPEENTPSPLPGLPEDWHLIATDKIVSGVDQVRRKASAPAIGIARSVVFGLLAALLGVIAAIMFLIGIVRLLDTVIPKDVWLVYLILGAIFCLVGALLWSKRPKDAASGI